MDLSCFSLYLFGFLFFCVFLLKLCRGWVVLLDNSSWMRVGELSEGLGIEDGDSPTHKKEVLKSVITILAIRIIYGTISNKLVNQLQLKM